MGTLRLNYLPYGYMEPLGRDVRCIGLKDVG